jgi:prophage maintenance system killer protein
LRYGNDFKTKRKIVVVKAVILNQKKKETGKCGQGLCNGNSSVNTAVNTNDIFEINRQYLISILQNK